MSDTTVLDSVSAPRDEGSTDREAIETTIEIAATPERVFSALTDPLELAAWWGSDDSYRTRDWQVDAQPGGDWSARTTDPSGAEGSIGGTFSIVDSPRVLESTWRASWDDDTVTTVRYELSPAIIGDVPGTRLRVTHAASTGSAESSCAVASWSMGYMTELAFVLGLLRPTVCRRRLVSCVG